MKVFIFMISISFVCLSNAKDFNNGCGSGWNEKLVPEKILLFGVNFTEQCRNHDNCYSKCLEGGENYEKPICKISTKSDEDSRRAKCDYTFQQEMEQSCKKSDKLRMPLCKGISLLYTSAVKIGGGGSFDGMVIPDEFYDFLLSEQAKNFDFMTLEKDMNQLQSLEAIKNNNSLELSIKNNAIHAEFTSTNNLEVQRTAISEGVFELKTIEYGNIELTKASNGVNQISFFDLNNSQIDVSRLKIESTFIESSELQD